MSKVSAKTKQIMNDAAFKNYCPAFVTGANNNACIMIDVVKERMFYPTKQQYHLLTNAKYKWTMYIAVFSYRNKEPREEFHFEIHETPERYKHEWCTTKFNEIHQKLLKECANQGVKISGAGWIASVNGHDFPEDKLFRLFNSINAWN